MSKFSSFAAAVLTVVVMEAVPVGSNEVRSAHGLKSELTISHDRSRVTARLARCKENRDNAVPCEDVTHWELPDLKVDAAARAITHEGAVVARWSRFGPFVRVQKPFRVVHEIEGGRAKLRIVRSGE